jgi:hypothetical protein
MERKRGIFTIKMNQTDREGFFRRAFILLSFLLIFSANSTSANTQNKSKLGTIKGIVMDESGKPIVGAIVSIFRKSTSKLIKQMYTDSDGNFSTRVFPGIYKISATADGYSSETVESIQINRSDEFSYGFKLERVGSGKTLPEKSPERNTPKYVIRASKLGRSIYQNSEADKSLWGIQPDETSVGSKSPIENEDLEEADRKNAQTAIEYYNSSKPSIAFNHFQQLSEKADLFIIGRIDSISFPQQKFQALLKYRFNRNNNFYVNSSLVRLNDLETLSYDSFSQASLEFFNEWKAHEGLFVVLGLNYSKQIGGKGFFNPKAGVKIDLDSATRIKSSFAPVASEFNPLERSSPTKDAILIFSSSSSQLSVLANQISNRFEISVERDLDQQSNVEVALLFDKSQIKEAKDQENRGLRILYSRRLNNTLSALAGYTFSGNQESNYQSFLGQINANLIDGTKVQAVFRFSPKATILSVDPFQSKLTVYDPGLSVFVIHPLPNLGLPISAEAILDIRNIFAFQPNNEKSVLKLGLSGRVFRGGISVKF